MIAARPFAPAGAVLALIHMAALLADFLAPYPFAEQQREFAFIAPTRLHWADEGGGWHWRPFVCSGTEPGARRSSVIRFFVRGYAYQFLGLFRCDRHLFGVDHPGVIFLLGTDGFGRDQFSRLLQGSRISLAAGWIATLLSLAIGTTLGTLAGFYGGWLDELIMRIGEASLSLPWLYLLLAGRAFLPLNLPPQTGYLMLIAAVGVLGWARPARLVRGVALSARERGYVVTARAMGASNSYLLRVHVMPETLGVVITQAALLVPRYTMAEVTLSFFGLGVDPPAPSWGNVLAGVQQYHVLVSYWWMLLPALAPAGVSICCFVIADKLLAGRRTVPL
jgi:peptide/nickel transport system permease protein